MTWLYDSVLGPPSQIALIVTALGIHYFTMILQTVTFQT